MKKRSSMRKAGWTLIELLIVIAIFTVLAVLLTTAAGIAKERTGAARCVSNLRQIGAGLHLYVQDHGVFPYYIDGNTRWLDGSEDPRSFFAGPYMGSAPRSKRFAGVGASSAEGGIFDCPAIRTEDKEGLGPAEWISDYFDYGLNVSLCGWPVAHFPNLSRTVALVEGGHYARVKAQGLSGRTYTPTEPSSPGGITWNYGLSEGRQSPIIFQNQKPSNFLFLDGHVGLHRADELAETWFTGR